MYIVNKAPLWHRVVPVPGARLLAVARIIKALKAADINDKPYVRGKKCQGRSCPLLSTSAGAPGMDRSQSWRESVERACQELRLPAAQITHVKEALIMRPVRKPSNFATVACQVVGVLCMCNL